MTSGENKRSALGTIRSLIEEHGISRAEVNELFAGDEEQGKASLLGRIFGILGAIFVFSGVSVFIALNWAAMNSAERIVITLGTGIAIFILALVADRDERYRRAVPSLFVVGALLQTFGLFVTLDELSTGDDWHAAAMSISGVLAIQNGIVFWQKRDAAPLFLVMAFGFWFCGTAFDWLDVDEEFTAVILGASAIGLSVGLDRTPFAGVTPIWYLAGSIGFLAGLYEILENTPMELLFLGFAAGGVFLSTVVKSRLMLGVSTIAMLAYIAEFTADHFADSLGWPIVLILIGISLIVLSGLAIRLNRKYIDSDRQSG